MMKNEKTRLQVRFEKTPIEDRIFVRCCFLVCGKEVGDFEQLMLSGNFALSVSDLIERIKCLPTFDFGGCKEIEDVFEGMSAAFFNEDFGLFENIVGYPELYDLNYRNFFAVPLSVEAFDGEQGFIFKFDNRWRFCWRQWNDRELNCIEVDRELFVAELESVLGRC